MELKTPITVDDGCIIDADGHELGWIHHDHEDIIVRFTKTDDENNGVVEAVLSSVNRVAELEAENAKLKEAAAATETRADFLYGMCPKLISALLAVLEWRNLDGDGISDPLRVRIETLLEGGA